MSTDPFQFDDFELNPAAFELRRGGAVVALQRIPFELLCLLVERRGQLVTREEILERVWGKGVFVDIESSINTAIRKLRRALGDDPEAPRFIATVPARGYRFIAKVQQSRLEASPSARSWSSNAMVGRAREFASLLEGLNDAASGRGRMFLISGQPGVGKTRLANELAREAQGKGVAVLVGHCAEHDEAVAYLPFVEILESFVDRGQTADHLRAALGEQGPELARLLPKLRNLLPDLARPLDLEPVQARRHLFNCIYDFIVRITAKQPAMIVLEDLHWADDSTLSLLEHLAQRLSGLPLMLIGTYRDAEVNLTPELAKTLDGLLRGRLADRLSIKSLTRDEVGVMLGRLSGKSPPASVVSEFFAETGGNPFFVEELLRHLEEENRLFDAAGEFHLELKVGELDAPPSVRLVVARRLSRLSESTQKVLATAAMIGRLCSLELLQDATEMDAEAVLDCVEEAEQAGLAISVAESRKIRVAFAHELIRQAVIAGLSAARRQRLHLDVAEAFERAYSVESDLIAAANFDYVPQLAHHFAHGGNPEKAVDYCLRALRQFSEIGSYAESIAQFENAIRLLPELPNPIRRAELELDLRIAVSGPLGDVKGLASAENEQSAERAMVLAREPGIASERIWWALYSAFWVRHLRPDTERACELGAELVAQADQHGRPAHQAEAQTSLAWAKMYAADFEAAARGFERGWEALETVSSSSDPARRKIDEKRHARITNRLGTRQNNRMVSGWNLWFLGYPQQAVERMRIATDIADAGNKSMLADIHGFASYVHELRGEPDLMRSRAQARLAIALESGYAAGRALSEIYVGWAEVLADDPAGGIARIRTYMAELKATGSEYINDRGLAFVAIALGRQKNFAEGLRTIDEAFAFVERTGQRFYAAELHRVRGELLLAQSPSNSIRAQQSFRTAIEVARQQRAKSWELRATTSLARLLAKKRKPDQARAMLEEIYSWFTEGFDTADLKNAKALLDKLKAQAH